MCGVYGERGRGSALGPARGELRAGKGGAARPCARAACGDDVRCGADGRLAVDGEDEGAVAVAVGEWGAAAGLTRTGEPSWSGLGAAAGDGACAGWAGAGGRGRVVRRRDAARRGSVASSWAWSVSVRTAWMARSGGTIASGPACVRRSSSQLAQPSRASRRRTESARERGRARTHSAAAQTRRPGAPRPTSSAPPSRSSSTPSPRRGRGGTRARRARACRPTSGRRAAASPWP